MAKLKKIIKKKEKKAKPKKEEAGEDESEGGMSLDDAFGDDEDVVYAEAKPAKTKKKDLDDELEEEIEELEKASNGFEQGEYTIKASKPISKVKKGDKIRIDGKEYEVDAHYVLIDHGATKEMALEIFSGEKDYQIRYFDDQIEKTLEFYELQEILYVKKPFNKVEW